MLVEKRDLAEHNRLLNIRSGHARPVQGNRRCQLAWTRGGVYTRECHVPTAVATNLRTRPRGLVFLAIPEGSGTGEETAADIRMAFVIGRRDDRTCQWLFGSLLKEYAVGMSR